MKVLGIDVASAKWSSVGSAIIEFDPVRGRFEAVRPVAIEWPAVDLIPDTLADAIDTFARMNGVTAVALDGPQGWRDPATPAGCPGVGRRCEYECRTQAKTGSYPTTFPGNQRPWIEFCIAVFDRLLSRPAVVLADASAVRAAPRNGYIVAECYPTSAWRSSGLEPLPGKGKGPALSEYVADLSRTYELPPITLAMSHDDLQAVVAALVAAAIVGGPALAMPCGTEATTVSGLNGETLRIEGLIWNVTPTSGPQLLPTRPRGIGLRDDELGGAVAARVTQPVIDQVARAGASQGQIALRGMPGGTKRAPTALTFTLNDEDFTLLVGDTNAAWRSHQDDTTSEAFERLYALLGDAPDIWHTARLVR